MRLWEDSGRVFFRCERAMSRDGIYKVWVRGDGGELLLGTLAPERDRLVLGRAMWQMELRRSGCWPVRAGRCCLAVAFGSKADRDGWYWEENPQHLVDKEAAQIGEWQRMLARKREDGVELASAWSAERPLPLAALFCLARSEQIRGEQYLVWKFDRQGRPCLPAQDEKK